MTRDEIDAAIKKHAEFETLYDRPYQDKRAVRVAGPFTVESLSPHRSLAFAGGPDTDHESATERAGEEQPDAPQFEASILENLVKAGIQNGLRGERIELESLEPTRGSTSRPSRGRRSPMATVGERRAHPFALVSRSDRSTAR